MKGAKGEHEANRPSVSSMVVGRGAKSQTAQRAPKGGQACALLMAAGAAVSMLAAGRELRAAPISAKPMVAARDAHTLTVPRVQREARHSAKHMEAASVVQPTAARRACMVGPSSASRMEVGRGARLKDAGRAQEAGRTVVLAMVGANDATSLAVERARREAPTSASHTVEAGAAHGDIRVQTSDQAVLLATVWQEAKKGYAINTACWWMTTVSTGVCRLVVSASSVVLPFLREMVLHAPKQACAASSCTRWRLLLAMWWAQPMKAGCMGGTLCPSCWTVVWDSGRSRPTTLMPVPLSLATGKIWRSPLALRSAAGCNARVRGLPPFISVSSSVQVSPVPSGLV